MRNLEVIFLFVVAYAKHEQYTGWSSYIVEPSSEDQLVRLASASDQYSLDFWIYPSLDREGIVIVKPEHQDGFFKVLEDSEITYRSHVADVKAQLDKEDFFVRDTKNVSQRAESDEEFSYDNYHKIETINTYMVNMSERYPDKVKLVIPAKSFEGRPIHYLKISTTNFENISKPVIFIDAGIHAREWIAPPTVTWAIRKLVENVTEPELLERFDWILLPVVNPDGYVYSANSNPLWRKTRSTDQHKDSGKCPGVDGNRNFDVNWGRSLTSKNPCDDTYGGSTAFCEVETRVVRDIMHEHLDRMALYINMHSYGNMILYPWSHSIDISPNFTNLRSVAIKMAKAIDRHGTSYSKKYKIGTPPMLLYTVSGVAIDYAHSFGVPLSFTFELPSYRSDGFHLRPSEIEQVCYETWKGIVVGVKMAGHLFVGKLNSSRTISPPTTTNLS